MAARMATRNDVPAVLEFLKDYHRETSDFADIPFETPTMHKTIEFYVTMPRHVCFIYERDGRIRGVLMGSADPLMFNSKRRWASDMLNVSYEGGAWLLKKFIAWAKAQKVDRIYMAVSTGDARADDLYEAVGLERMGGMYGLVLDNKEPQ